VGDLKLDLDLDHLGSDMFRFVEELFPICRSITGEGIRTTLNTIAKRIPFRLQEVPSGTQVFDWEVPKEWNIRDAYIEDGAGRRVVDFREHNLHVVGYSSPVSRRMPISKLKQHLHSLPDQPHLIPYRTSYYSETWGFCMPHEKLTQLSENEYKICIDSTLEPGNLTYGECYLQGDSKDEILISCHCCHPSIANDNLSGIALATQLAEHLESLKLRYSYRFLFIPATIGSITWLARNEDVIGHIKHGLVVASVGDPGHPTYKRSRRGDAPIDRAVEHVLRHSAEEYEIRDFSPYGYDERQYCSPGFNLAVGSLTRTPNGEYPEYHTSADNLDFIKSECLADSFQLYLRVFDVLENDGTYINLSPKGEPQLGRRGLYPAVGAQGTTAALMARLWVLNLSDGGHTLLDIAERAHIPFAAIREAAHALLDGGLLELVSDSSPS
jgi:aminopeptidase-like protein